MSADHLQFLRDKFISGYEEEVNDPDHRIPLRSRFQKIVEILRKMPIDSSTPISMKNSLYDLKFVFSECIMLGERDVEHGSQNRKWPWAIQAVKRQWFLRKVRRRLEKIKEELRGSSHNGDGIPFPEEKSSDPAPEWMKELILWESCPLLNEQETHGFDVQMLQNIEALAGGDGVRAIGIVGMGGSGKSTLAHVVFSRLRKLGQFDPMVLVELSEKRKSQNICLIKALTHNIRGHFVSGKYLYECVPEGVLQDLHPALDNRKYLLVIDNVWHASDWCNDLVSKFGNKGLVIVTSRFKEVVVNMVDEQNLIQVHPVNRDTCWSIFLDTARETNNATIINHPNLLSMKDEIIDRCCGLPLAAKTLGQIIPYQIAHDQFWLDPSVTKRFRLKMDKDQKVLPSEVLRKVRTCPGVDFAYFDSDKREIEAEGSCIPEDVAMELEKLCGSETKAFSFEKRHYYWEL